MPSFSFTAPIVTLDQERREWQELTKEEREIIERDVYGEILLPSKSSVTAAAAAATEEGEGYTDTATATTRRRRPSAAASASVAAAAECDGNQSIGRRPEGNEEAETETEDGHHHRSKDSKHENERKKIDNMMQLLRDLLVDVPDKEKIDLMDAMEAVPDLIYRESNFSRYVEYNGDSNNNVNGTTASRQLEQQQLEAAQRIAQYWKKRANLFGPVQALKPMTLLGAMEDVGVACLQKGIVTILPNDECGRAVIFFDRIRAIPAIASRETVLKIIFYMLQKAFYDDEETGKDGFVFIENISGYDLYTHFDRLLSKNQMFLLRDCFPCKLKAYHIWGGASGGWALDLILPVVKQLAGKEIRLRMVCHTKADRNFSSTYKFNPDHLSCLLGGNFSYASHLRWVERMAALELFMDHNSIIKPTFGSFSASHGDDHSIGSLQIVDADTSSFLLPMLSPTQSVSNNHQSLSHRVSSEEMRSFNLAMGDFSNSHTSHTNDYHSSMRTAQSVQSPTTMREVRRNRLRAGSLDDSFHTSRTFKSAEGPRAA
mmetsp:Transcript_26259/g.62412  ORF Transcript_26259/g.62412 Transcript_26259/m.62412 type:complete len:543 (-) Transcript_26259:1517-3145(-)